MRYDDGTEETSSSMTCDESNDVAIFASASLVHANAAQIQNETVKKNPLKKNLNENL